MEHGQDDPFPLLAPACEVADQQEKHRYQQLQGGKQCHQGSQQSHSFMLAESVSEIERFRDDFTNRTRPTLPKWESRQTKILPQPGTSSARGTSRTANSVRC